MTVLDFTTPPQTLTSATQKYSPPSLDWTVLILYLLELHTHIQGTAPRKMKQVSERSFFDGVSRVIIRVVAKRKGGFFVIFYYERYYLTLTER